MLRQYRDCDMWKHGVKLSPESKREVRCFENTDRFRQLVLEDANQRLGFREKATSLTLDDIEAIYVACTFGQVSSQMQFYSVDLSKRMIDFAWRVYQQQQPLIIEDTDLFCSFQQLVLDSDPLRVFGPDTAPFEDPEPRLAGFFQSFEDKRILTNLSC